MYEAKIESGIRNKTYVQVMNELQGAFVPSYVLMKYRNKFEVIVQGMHEHPSNFLNLSLDRAIDVFRACSESDLRINTMSAAKHRRQFLDYASFFFIADFDVSENLGL